MKLSALVKTMVVLPAWVALCGVAHAWQLQPLPLEERVNAAPLIVLAQAERLLKREKSLIAGTGDRLTVRLHVIRTIKGEEMESLTVEFSEVAVQGGPSSLLHQPRVWLLEKLPGMQHWRTPAVYESVLLPDSVKAIDEIL